MTQRLNLKERITVISRYYRDRNANATAADLGLHHRSTVTRLVNKFEETGSVHDLKSPGRPSIRKNHDFQTAIADEVLHGVPTSTRRITAQLNGGGDFNVGHMTVYRALKEMKYKPYIPRLLQALHEDDGDRRVQFCETFLDFYDGDFAFVDRILWSDEATFKLNGHLNRHNCIYWATENPQVILENEVNLPGLTVWCGIHSGGIVGPYFYEGTVTSESYLEMLRGWLWPQIQDRNFILQQDGATPHYARIVRSFLDDHFPSAWIGRRGWMEWPARSPDLTPPDFFLWGFVKDKVYSRSPQTLKQLRTFIEEAITSVSVDLCQKVCRSVPHRLRLCMECEGHHFEHKL